ncbi:MAG TPA: aminopeptidase, partial [bacterium]|nr:aminopeptidase [bacterium]
MPKILICVIALNLTGCGFFITPRSSDQVSIREENLVAHLTYLASDELEGREAGTRGEKLAAGYIASQLRQNGVKPFAL